SVPVLRRLHREAEAAFGTASDSRPSDLQLAPIRSVAYDVRCPAQFHEISVQDDCTFAHGLSDEKQSLQHGGLPSRVRARYHCEWKDLEFSCSDRFEVCDPNNGRADSPS